MRNLLSTLIIASLLGVTLLLPSAFGQSNTVSEMMRRYELMTTHRLRLETRLSEEGARIARLKQHRNDQGETQLKTALQVSQELASKLTQLNEQIRQLSGTLTQTLDRAIKQTSDSDERKRLVGYRQSLEQKNKAHERVVLNTKVTANDSQEDLEEKADILSDSEEKIRKQLNRVESQLARLEHQHQLARHGRAAEETLFVEGTAQRLGGARTGAILGLKAGTSTQGKTASDARTHSAPPSGTAQNEAIDSQDPNSAAIDNGTGNMSASPQPGSYTGNAASKGSESITGNDVTSSKTPGEGLSPMESPSVDDNSGSASATVSLRDVLDPTVFRELERSGNVQGSVEERMAALRQASAKLKSLATQLSAKSKQLRERAKQLK